MIHRRTVLPLPPQVSLIPDGIDDDQAAAYLAGAGYLTGYLALTELAKFRPRQTVLAPGIGGAVGMETVQVARRLGASLAISTASSTKKANQARAAGYDHVIDLSKETLKEGVMRITEGKGVDIVVDGVSGKLTGEGSRRSPLVALWSLPAMLEDGRPRSTLPTSSGRLQQSAGSLSDSSPNKRWLQRTPLSCNS